VPADYHAGGLVMLAQSLGIGDLTAPSPPVGARDRKHNSVQKFMSRYIGHPLPLHQAILVSKGV
jgi:hypothetical protein